MQYQICNEDVGERNCKSIQHTVNASVHWIIWSNIQYTVQYTFAHGPIFGIRSNTRLQSNTCLPPTVACSPILTCSLVHTCRVGA